MKPTRRYTTEAQILAAIDKTYQAAQRYLERAEAIDAEIRYLQSQGVTYNVNGSTIDDLKFDIKKLRKQADYQVETRAKKLGMRLSELRTNLLPIPDLVGEEGVPMKLSGLAKVA